VSTRTPTTSICFTAAPSHDLSRSEVHTPKCALLPSPRYTAGGCTRQSRAAYPTQVHHLSSPLRGVTNLYLCGRDLLSRAPRPPHSRVSVDYRSATARAGEDHQSELANLDLVSAPELRFVDAFPVDVGAVEATHIADTERAASPVELYVPPGDRHVVQEDIAVRVPSRRGEVLVQQETAPRVRTAFHDEQGSPRGQGFHRGRIRADGVDAVGFSLQRLDAAERNRGRRL